MSVPVTCRGVAGWANIATKVHPVVVLRMVGARALVIFGTSKVHSDLGTPVIVVPNTAWAHAFGTLTADTYFYASNYGTVDSLTARGRALPAFLLKLTQMVERHAVEKRKLALIEQLGLQQREREAEQVSAPSPELEAKK